MRLLFRIFGTAILTLSVVLSGCGCNDDGQSSPHACGNGEIDDGEQCDGDNLGGKSCADLGYSGGTLACKTDCSFDVSGCEVGNWCWQNPLPQGNSLFGIWGSSPSDVFAVGSEGTMLHYDGSTWSEVTSGTSNWLEGIWGSSSSDFFAVGEKGTILHYRGA